MRELLNVYNDACASHLLCDRHPAERVAFTLVDADLNVTELTFGSLREESARVAGGLLAMGARRGDRIATLMGKTREYIVALMAIWRIGAVHVPLFTAFAPAAIAFRLEASGSRFVFCDAPQAPKLRELLDNGASGWRAITTGGAHGWAHPFEQLLNAAPTDHAVAVGADGPIVQIYTSGTTGAPKGVIVPLRAVASFQGYLEFGLDVRTDDVFWNAADPGWAYGLYIGVIASLAAGVGGLLLNAGFSPETAFSVLERFGVTNLAAAPTIYRAMRTSGIQPGRLALRAASSAGEPLTPDVNAWALGALGVEVRDHYGQTETGMVVNNHQHPALREPLRPGSMGKPMPGWSMAILGPDETPAATGEVGRVAADLPASPLAWFTGYVDAPAAAADKFSSDGRWYFTGDVGRIDEDGYLYFAARDDDVILMAGYRIGPIEIETVLCAHAAVAEAAAVAVPDEVRGEVLEAVVVLRPGVAASEALTGELQAWVKKRYAAHAYPRRVHYAESLPRTASGKVQRSVIRKQLTTPRE